MLVTKDDLYDGLEFKIGSDKYKILNYTNERKLLDLYSYQTETTYKNNTFVEAALKYFTEKRWVITTPLIRIYECW